MIPRKHKELLHSIGEYAGKLGLKAWVVGGAVRDFYRGKDTQDLDLTFEGSPEAVAGFCIKKWGGEKKRFSQFNTYRVKLNNGLKLDLVQARKEYYARPGALPQVSPSTIKDDLFRRDFSLTHLDQRAHYYAHHVIQKAVAGNFKVYFVAETEYIQTVNRAHGGLCLTARRHKRRKIVLAHYVRGGAAHFFDVQRKIQLRVGVISQRAGRRRNIDFIEICL